MFSLLISVSPLCGSDGKETDTSTTSFSFAHVKDICHYTAESFKLYNTISPSKFNNFFPFWYGLFCVYIFWLIVKQYLLLHLFCALPKNFPWKFLLFASLPYSSAIHKSLSLYFSFHGKKDEIICIWKWNKYSFNALTSYINIHVIMKILGWDNVYIFLFSFHFIRYLFPFFPNILCYLFACTLKQWWNYKEKISLENVKPY